jgi:hypothetical protein
MDGNIYRMTDVPLMGQPTDGVCWFTSARMVYAWRTATNKGSMTDPMAHAESKRRYDGNGDWDGADNHFLAKYFNMASPTITLDNYDSVKAQLDAHGPIWTSVLKTWGGMAPHGHVVVICGVADTGVYINDPEPVRQGSGVWLTWAQIQNGVKGRPSANPTYLSAL